MSNEEWTPPWAQGVLKDWTIVGMNHYHQNGERRLFVAMTKDGKCIKAEGKDNKLIWEYLWNCASP